MKTLHCISLIVTVFLFIQSSFGKEINQKFGKVSIDELNMSTCPIDSNAHAFYLFDKGYTQYVYYSDGFKINYNRQFRIKILDQTGFDQADFAISYNDYGTNKDYIGAIKAVSYNLVNGKIEETKIDKDNIFRERINKYRSSVKFALPNVKEGTVIEVSYDITSDRIGAIPPWKFQYDIPVLQSNYEISVPEYFHFNQFIRGYIKIDTKQSSASGTFNSASQQTYRVDQYAYKATNVPAFPVGEQLTTPDNYISWVEYELDRYEVPGVVYKSFSTTWEAVDETLIEDEDFGLKLNNTGFLKDDAEKIALANSDAFAKMNAAFELVKQKTKWDGSCNCWSSSPLRKVYDNGTGNSADINLTLVALLKKLDLDAVPVVLSTRSNGIIHPTHPSINQLDYVVAACRINGETYLLDATEKYSEIDVLPTRCLNGEGRIIDQAHSGWISLLKNKSAKSSTYYLLKLNDEGTISGTITCNEYEFQSTNKRNAIHNYESTDKYIEKLEENNPKITIDSFKFVNLDTINVPLKYTYYATFNKYAESAGDLMFFTPMMMDGYEKNPFSLEKREYPVEYPYPSSEKVFITIQIPDGYVLESLPKPLALTALDKGFKFSFVTAADQNKINISSTLDINQTIIASTSYDKLRGFFQMVVEKHLEKVVLKKI
jgi:hypothetical protein